MVSFGKMVVLTMVLAITSIIITDLHQIQLQKLKSMGLTANLFQLIGTL